MVIEAAPIHVSKRLTIVRPGGAGDAPPRSQAARFARDVRDGLLARPRTLPWPYFYDAHGSALFEEICLLPEYYLTRTEDAILRAHSDAMVACWPTSRSHSNSHSAATPTLVELGSGSATKTRRLIASALAAYGPLQYVPIDVSATALEESAHDLLRRFPALRVAGYVATYQAALAAAAARIAGPKLLIFLGSSLGNYEADAAAGLLRQVARVMGPDDRLLLGTDLAKDRAVLEAAYDDARGVTAAFNKNLLARINRELGADFDLDRFAHRAVYRPELGRVEMHLVATEAQAVRIPGADLTARFEAGESIHTESSHKYTLDALRALADRAGFAEEAAWTDPDSLFRVQRWRPRA